jgi:hypothetical protein
MNNYEHELQKACITWFRLQYPKFKLNLFAIPNGGHRHRLTAKKLKAEGVVSGVSDLFLAVPSGGSHGLFIEMKVKPNRPTDNQILFGKCMMESGYHFELCYSLNKFIEIVTLWMK